MTDLTGRAAPCPFCPTPHMLIMEHNLEEDSWRVCCSFCGG